MNNPLWEWLVRTRISASAAEDQFSYPEPFRFSENFLGPPWCFDRIGQSVTPLPDGRVVLIAGEHEDGYDPCFNIYNDVAVYHPDGSLDIFGYPKEVFSPTDFHSATLVGDRIVVIGNLGYGKNRKEGETQVAELDIANWSIRMITTSGQSPGWIHKHVANISNDGRSIVLCGGLIDAPIEAGKHRPLMENPNQWELSLESWTWCQTTHDMWERYAFGAEGVRWLPFSEMRHLPSTMLYYGKSEPDPDKPTPQQVVPPEKWEEFQSRFAGTNAQAKAEAAKLYGKGFNPDLEVSKSLYKSDVAHEQVPESETEEEWGEEDEAYEEDGPFDFDEEDYSDPEGVLPGTRILVDGVVVRYKEAGGQVVLTIEGTLPETTVAALVSDLQRKLEILLARPVYVERL